MRVVSDKTSECKLMCEVEINDGFEDVLLLKLRAS